MKQIVSNYSYSPATNVVTLTGVNIEQDQLLLVVAPQVGRTMYNFASGVTGTVVAGTDTRVTLNASTAGLTTTSPLVIFYDDQASAQSVTGTVALDPASLIALENVTVTVGSSVSISNFPATQTIAGTVTANVGNYSTAVTNNYKISGSVSSVTAMPVVFPEMGTYGSLQGHNGTNGYLHVGLKNLGNTSLDGRSDLPISGTVTANGGTGLGTTGNNYGTIALGVDDTNTANPIKLDGNGNLVVSGTVTVGAVPNGSLTTRFGTPTTANTAFATSAVTNASRKYLLIQNVTTGSNVITVGIGFTPTTTQGIQLTAGAGITFESSYIPTGAVYVLSSVTASNFTILEA